MRQVVPFLFLAILQGFLAWGNPPDGMVLVPAGEFTMGTDDVQVPAAQPPARKVYLEAFYIDIHEVTPNLRNLSWQTGTTNGCIGPEPDGSSFKKSGSTISTPVSKRIALKPRSAFGKIAYLLHLNIRLSG